MRPNYVARKSVASVLSVWLILFFWLIIPLIIQIARIVAARCYSVEFYDERVVVRSGVLNKNERQSVFAGVYSVRMSQSLWGRIFRYGNISVDCPGKWDIDTNGVANPAGLKHYLESKITAEGMTKVVYN